METATIVTATGIGMGAGIATAIVTATEIVMATATEIVTATAATAMVAVERGTVGGEKRKAGKGQALTKEERKALPFQIHQNARRAGGTVRAKPLQETSNEQL